MHGWVGVGAWLSGCRYMDGWNSWLGGCRYMDGWVHGWMGGCRWVDIGGWGRCTQTGVGRWM